MPADPNFKFQRFYDGLKDRGYVIYPGKLTVADSFRIGCIGRLDAEHMRGALAAVREILAEMGVATAARRWPRSRRRMAPDSLNTIGGDDHRQRPRYRLPEQPVVVVCVDGSEPGYIEARRRGRAARRGSPRCSSRAPPDRRLRRAELHQPQQPLDRHRRAAGRARHLRQLLLRPRDRGRGDDERPEVPAGRRPSSRPSSAPAADRGGHRQGQAARPARQGAGARRRARPAASPRRRPTRRRSPRTASTNVLDLVGMAVPDVYSAPS